MAGCWCCSYDQNSHKDYIRGGVDASDFEDEVRYRHPKRRAKKSRARSQTRTPCPHTEDGKHVYVWTAYESVWNNKDKIFYRYFGFYREEIQVCCGCGVTKGWHRPTERYMKVKDRKWRKLTGGEFDVKRGEPVSRRWGTSYRYFTWESQDEGYRQAIKDYELSYEARLEESARTMRRLEMRRKLLGLN